MCIVVYVDVCSFVEIFLRGETLDLLVIEWHDGGLSGMPLRRETLDP